MDDKPNRHTLKRYDIPLYEPDIELDIEPDETVAVEPLPDDHPCCDCTALRTDSGVPYCFLPRCDKEIFKLSEDDE